MSGQELSLAFPLGASGLSVLSHPNCPQIALHVNGLPWLAGVHCSPWGWSQPSCHHTWMDAQLGFLMNQRLTIIDLTSYKKVDAFCEPSNVDFLPETPETYSRTAVLTHFCLAELQGALSPTLPARVCWNYGVRISERRLRHKGDILCGNMICDNHQYINLGISCWL